MALRTINNPLHEQVLLPLLPAILCPGTQLAQGSGSGTGVEQCYVMKMSALAQGKYPAVLIHPGDLHTARTSLTTAAGTQEVLVSYYDRWDRQTTPILQVEAAIYADLSRMLSNLQTYLREQGGMLVSGVLYPTSILSHYNDPFEHAVDRYNLGMTAGSATMHITLQVLPYTM